MSREYCEKANAAQWETNGAPDPISALVVPGEVGHDWLDFRKKRIAIAKKRKAKSSPRLKGAYMRDL
jgi:hypothetical protein